MATFYPPPAALPHVDLRPVPQNLIPAPANPPAVPPASSITYPPSAHAYTHLNDGSDTIPVATAIRTGLLPILPNNAALFLDGTGHYSAPPVGGGGGDMNSSVYDPSKTGTVLTAASVPWTGVTGKPATFTPSTHASTHNLGGSDPTTPDWTQINNKPASFAPAVHGVQHLDNGTDVIPVVTTTRTGLTPKLNGNSGTFLNGTGVFSSPAATGDMLKSVYDKTNAGSCDLAKAVPWSGITAVPTTFNPSAHATTHNIGGTDAVSPDWAQIQNKVIASATAAGLVRQLSGSTTDYVGGDNNCHPLPGIAGGGFAALTGTYTLATGDNGKYFICTGGSWTLTLPVASASFSIRIRNDQGISGTTGTITITPQSGSLINGIASLALLPGQECTIISDSTNWRTLGLQREVIIGTNDITVTTASAVILLPVGYRFFDFELDQIGTDTDGVYLQFQLSGDGGATWATGSSNYYDAVVYDNTATVAAYSIAPNSAGLLSQVQTTAAINGNCGRSRLRLFPGSASANASWSIMSGGWRNTDARQHSYWSQSFFNGGSGVKNAIKIFPNTGNITRAFITVKGTV
jgi:hypothetical protein